MMQIEVRGIALLKKHDAAQGPIGGRELLQFLLLLPTTTHTFQFSTAIQPAAGEWASELSICIPSELSGAPPTHERVSTRL